MSLCESLTICSSINWARSNNLWKSDTKKPSDHLNGLRKFRLSFKGMDSSHHLILVKWKTMNLINKCSVYISRIIVSINAVIAWSLQPWKQVWISAGHSYGHTAVFMQWLKYFFALLIQENIHRSTESPIRYNSIHCQNDATSIKAKPKNLYFPYSFTALNCSLYFESHVSDNLSVDS